MVAWLKRPGVWLLLLVLLVVAVATLAYRQRPSRPRDDAVQAKFDAIRMGATEKEVEALLGPYGAVGGPATGSAGPCAPVKFCTIPTADGRGVGVFVSFDQNGRVSDKRLMDGQDGILSEIAGLFLRRR